MTALNWEKLPVQKKGLFVPTLHSVANVLTKGLKDNYSEVLVEVVDCPDLTQSPFGLANVGLNGNPRVVEVGYPMYAPPHADDTKIYDLVDLPMLVDLESAFIIGASTGTHTFLDANAESIININVDKDKVNQLSRICKATEDGESYIQEALPEDETRYTFLGNFFVCEGKPGPVLKVHVRKRIGTDDFPGSIRKILRNYYGDKVIGLGGTFLINKGKVQHHLMPKFSQDDLYTKAKEDVFNWFKFFIMSAPLTAVGVLATDEYDIDLRDQHFHTFSDHGDAGHYRIDTTPEIVEYEGYFNIAEVAYRIDRPTDETLWEGLM